MFKRIGAKKSKYGAFPLSFELLNQSGIGLWAVELDENSNPRMYGDEAMQKIIGVDELTTPEDVYRIWYENIDPEHIGEVKDAMNRMAHGTSVEMQYKWSRKGLRPVTVRSSGTSNPNYKKGIRIEGVFRDVTDLAHFEKQLIAKVEEAEKIIDSFINSYNVAYTVNMADDTFTQLRMDKGIIGYGVKFDCFTQALDFFVNKAVFEPDRELMRREVSYDTIKRKIAVNHSYTEEYRVLYCGVPLWHEMTVTRLDDDFIAIGFTEMDRAIVLRHLDMKMYDDYFALFSIDFDHESLKVIKECPYFSTGGVGSVAPYTSQVLSFAQTFEGETKTFFSNFSDIEYAKRVFSKEDKFTYSYQSILDGEKTVIVTGYVVVKHEDGTPAVFTLGFSLLDTLESDRQELQNLLRENMEIISGLADEYLALLYVNMSENIVKVYSVDESRLPGIKQLLDKERDHSKLLKEFVDSSAVHPDDKELFDGLSFQGIRNRLSGRKKFSIRFRMKYGSAYLWTVIDILKYEPADEEANIIAIGFAERNREIIEEQNSQIKLQNALSEAKEANRRISEQKHFLDFFIESYSSVYSIDLLNDTFEILHMDHRSSEIFKTDGNRADMEAFIANHIHPEDHELIRTVIDKGYVMDSLKNETSFTFTVREVFDNEIRIMRGQIVRGIDQYHVGVAFLDITEEMRIEKEQYALSDGLTREYHTVWLLDGFGKHYMHFYRSTGIKTNTDAVQLGLDVPLYDSSIIKYINTYVHEEDRERVLEETKFETIERETPDIGTYVVSYRRYNQEHTSYDYHQMCYAKAVASDGSINYIFAFRDADKIIREQIAQQKQLEDALAMAKTANRAKTTFLNNMSHDIRTPMNAIIGYTTLAEHCIDNPEQAISYLGKIKLSSKHLLSIINDVLDMSKIESGKIDLNNKEENLLEIIGTISDFVKSDVQLKKQTFKIYKNELIHPYVICDKMHLNRVLLNILSNAIKYTPDGGCISMRLSEKMSAIDGIATYQFYVSDNGIGMSEEFLGRIFESFTRAKTATESGIQGTGLGMAITKSIVDIMGGNIEIQSEQNKGTQITITFDFNYLNEEEFKKATEVSVIENFENEFAGKRVLIVEDNEFNLEICTELLSEYGFLVDSATNGQDAVQTVLIKGVGYYDFILMDIQMPVMNGYEATKAIRNIPNGNSIPIIALSANTFSEDVEKSLDYGMNAHIGKPIEKDVLFDALRNCSKDKCLDKTRAID